ncbi:MAG: monooxygenase [Thermomicrobiales bacterium]|nr:monooxygenase [Thermomicrobiales bacterium]
MTVVAEDDIRVDCCIAGCGPAGAMLGLLLARAGLKVLVLEKHGDFLRDFRGDTIHPSTMEILAELGLDERFLQLPHSEVSSLTARTPAGLDIDFSFRRLKTRFPFIAFVPQWDFLDFITDEAARYPGFRLLMNAEVVDLIQEHGVVSGLTYRDGTGAHEIRARLTVGADGRSSRTREAAGLRVIATSPPMDVLWFRLSRRPEEPETIAMRSGPGKAAILIDRRDYWQIGYIIPKGDAEKVRVAGLAPFRRTLAELIPDLADRVDEIQEWEQVKLLTVRSDRLARWYTRGYLAIGDAAHAMSPVAGVGINLAIQDAVVAANVLWQPLRRGRISTRDLAKVQHERELPVRLTQAVQAVIQQMFFKAVLTSVKPPLLPQRILRVLLRVPVLGDLPARFVAFGIHRPHIESPALAIPVEQPTANVLVEEVPAWA